MHHVRSSATHEAAAARRLQRILGHVTPVTAAQPACGIVGVVATQGDVSRQVMEGLIVLQNRGYDSAGIATIADGRFYVEKCASVSETNDAIARLEKMSALMPGSIGMGHTRWATHGGRTDVNAHPHVSHSGRIALIHNGIIENADELRMELKEAHGVTCVSETDTEVVAQLLDVIVTREQVDVARAYELALPKMRGTWGFVVMDVQNPSSMFVASKGSPLLIGIGRGCMFVASEASAFSRHTKEYIALAYGESAVLTATGHSLAHAQVLQAEEEEVILSPDPYPHWTIREIMEQPSALQRSLLHGGRIKNDAEVKLGGLDGDAESLLAIDHLLITACGTSLFAGHFAARLMRMLHAFTTVSVVDAAEMGAEDFPTGSAGLLVISQSGETKDVHRCIMLADEKNIPVFAAVNKVGSLIARSAMCGTYIHAGREMGVASTKAFMCQSCILVMMSLWFAQRRAPGNELTLRRQLIDSLHRLPTMAGMALRLQPQCHGLAQSIVASGKRSMFVLGKGLAHSIAMEGALKIKEISYLHAEGYSGGALKHGPYALIEAGTPVILILLADNHAALMRSTIEEVHSRGANVIVITPEPSLVPRKIDANQIVRVPANGPLSALSCVVPLQLLAYELSTLLGINPDAPRNLAKAITVD